MYVVVQKFYQTKKSITEILKEYGNQKDPVEIALLLVIQHMDEMKIPDESTYQKIDEAVKCGHSDEEMFLLFIVYLLMMYSRDLMAANKRDFIIEKSDSVYRISCAINLKAYREDTQAYYYQTCSQYYYVRNNFAKGDELNLLSISLMPKTSTRYLDFIGKVAQILGNIGRLSIVPNLEQELFSEPQNQYFYAIRSLFMNALFTVNHDSINKYLSYLKTNFNENYYFRKDKTDLSVSIINGNLDKTNSNFPEMSICISYYRALKDKDYETAKKIFGSIRESYFYFTCNYLFYFAELHHSFVTSWFEKIEQIIKNKDEKSYHYLMDFFIARYFLVKNQKELARFYFAQLIKNCEKFKAIGRLKYEMQFAIELTANSFFEFIYPRQIINANELRKSLEIAMAPSKVDLVGMSRIIGSSKSINEIKKKIKLFADIQKPILIIGETGAGKEILAQAIHEESIRKNKPFLAINCGALTDTLLQSELFGYETGSFTGAVGAHKGIFEAAEDGVVFLDEFGEMSPKLQVSLLRILENNELLRVGGTKAKAIKCRIIAATNANIEELIQKKLFREDLYYRLKQFSLVIPPLRERKEDIPELIDYFLNYSDKNQSQAFSNEVMNKFQEYHWPGNIRELKNEIDRIKILCGNKPVIELNDLDIAWLHTGKAPRESSYANISPQLVNTNEQVPLKLAEKRISSGERRKQQILQLFQQSKQLTRIQIAETLGVSLLTITRDLKVLCANGIIIKRMPTLSPQSHYFEVNDDL